MCEGKPYHTPGKKQEDYHSTWYECTECGVILGHQSKKNWKCSMCGKILSDEEMRIGWCLTCKVDVCVYEVCDFDSIP